MISVRLARCRQNHVGLGQAGVHLRGFAQSVLLIRSGVNYRSELHTCFPSVPTSLWKTDHSIVLACTTPPFGIRWDPSQGLFPILVHHLVTTVPMDKMVSFDAILFPADERAPHLVSLMTSNAPSFPPLGQSCSQQPPSAMVKIPHPEMYMDFIAEGVGARAWQRHVSSSSYLDAFCLFPSAPGVSSLSLHSNFFIFLVAHLARSRSGVTIITPPSSHIFQPPFPTRSMLIRRS